MAAVLRGSRYLVGRCCKHVDFAFGKYSKLRPCAHCVGRLAYFATQSYSLKDLRDVKTAFFLEMWREKFE